VPKANKPENLQAYNAPSPNGMVIDSSDYAANTEPVAIINPNGLEQEADQLQDLPLANDCTSEKQHHTNITKKQYQLLSREVLTRPSKQMRR
jgi:hypothetical protein